jgi:beta-lactamase class D
MVKKPIFIISLVGLLIAHLLPDGFLYAQEPILQMEPRFGEILDSAGMEGSILIYDENRNFFYSNDFTWAMAGRLPASTFKIPHSIIALETSVVRDSNHILIWDGQERYMDSWEKDLHLADAFRLSCVPCYQEIAQKVGTDQMVQELERIGYGGMDVRTENLTVFWLEGDSRIDQFEQVDFLQRLYRGKLPIRKENLETIRGMLYLESFHGHRLSGKTGWAIRNGQNNGWFVGYLETGKNVLFFATNVKPGVDFSMDLFPVLRREVTEQALEFLLTL